MMRTKEFKLLYRDFPKLFERLKYLNEKVLQMNEEWGEKIYEYKQMCFTDPTMKEWEARFKKECEFESRETSLF